VPRLINEPTRVPVPGGKVINEHVGRVSTGSEAVSVAHLIAVVCHPAFGPETVNREA